MQKKEEKKIRFYFFSMRLTERKAIDRFLKLIENWNSFVSKSFEEKLMILTNDIAIKLNESKNFL